MKIPRSLPLIVILLAFYAGLLASARAITYPPASSFLWGDSSVDAPGQTSFVNGSEEGLPYRFLLPRNYDPSVKYPVVFFLHGWGEKGADNAEQLKNSANGAMAFVSTANPDNQTLYPTILVCPQSTGFLWRTKKDEFRKIVNTLKTYYSIDEDRIAVTGLSFGGEGAYGLIKDMPNFFSCMLTLSGGRGDVTLEKLPIWVFHAEDDGSIPSQNSDGAVAWLRDRGFPVLYTRYQSGGHTANTWKNAYAMPEVTKWVFDQRRGQPMQGLPLVQVQTTSLAKSPITITGTTLLAPGMTVTRVGWCRDTNGGGITASDGVTDGTKTFVSASGSFSGTGLAGYRIGITKLVSDDGPLNEFLYDIENVVNATTLTLDRFSTSGTALKYYFYKPGGKANVNPWPGTTTDNWATWSMNVDVGSNQTIQVIAEMTLSNTTLGGRTTCNYPVPVKNYVAPTGDLVAPTLTISSPSFPLTTAASTLTITGLASDNVGVTSVTWSTNRGYSGTATGASMWAITGLPLSGGPNTIAISAKDAKNNTATTYLQVAYNPPAGADATAPSITILSPTANETYTTTDASITLSGTASDNIGVVGVVWTNNTLNTNGPATGTANWSASVIPLASGTNLITVTGSDAAGNTQADTITVTRSASPVNQAPTVDAGPAGTVTLPDSITLSGTAADDGLPSGSTLTTTWSKVSGPGAVTFSSTTSLTPTVTFGAPGSYTLRLTAGDGTLTASDDVGITVNPAATGGTSQRLNFDFGMPDLQTTDTGWNNVTASPAGSGATNCVDSTGTPTGVSVSITQAFSGPGNHTTPPTSPLFPQAAVRDYIFAETTPGILRFAGLETGATYKVTVYAYRGVTGLDRVGKYTIGAETKILNAAGNLTDTAVFTGVAPAADGSIDLMVERNTGSTYAYLSVLVLEKEIPPPSPLALRVDFGMFGQPTAETGWNNITNGAVGTGIADCVDTDGAPTGVGVSITQKFEGPGDNPNAPASPIYPQTAMRDYVFSETAASKLRLTNLDPASTYLVTVYGYRDATGGGRVGKYTIGAASQTLNAAGNLSNKAVFTGVTPGADGSIELTVERDTGSTYAYLSVLELEKETASSSQQAMAVQEATLEVAQGGAGAFKRTLALNGEPSVESRRRADGEYTVGFTFNKTVTSASASLEGTATLDGAPVVSGSTVTVTLKEVANQQTLRVNLDNITTAGGDAAGSASVSVKILAGDVNTSTNVNSTDVLLIKSEENQPVTSANAANDVDANGVIDATDVNAARAALGAEAP